MSDTEEGGRHRTALTAVAALIIANIVVWVLWQFARDSGSLQNLMFAHFTVGLQSIEAWRIHTLLTYSLSHQELGHIVFNLIFFWVLGRDVEAIYGYRNFMVLYFFAALLAAFAHLGFQILQGSPVPVLGASGAVMGVAVVAAIFDPERPLLLFGLLPIKLKWLVAGFIVLDLLGASSSGSLVSHSAHLGGALGGFLFWKLDIRLFPSAGRSNIGLLNRLRRLFRRKPHLRVFKRQPLEELPEEKMPPRKERRGRASTTESAKLDAATRKRVDELLSKISREGIGALTDEEREFLKQSSQKYRR